MSSKSPGMYKVFLPALSFTTQTPPNGDEESGGRRGVLEVEPALGGAGNSGTRADCLEGWGARPPKPGTRRAS